MAGKWMDLAQHAFSTGTDASDYDKYMTFFAPDCKVIIGEGQWDPIIGREAWVIAQRAWNECFSNRKHTFLNSLESEREAAFEVVLTATHTGPMPGPNGGYIQATGRDVRWPMALWDEYDENDLIKVRRCYYDQTVLFNQLGIMPEIPGTPEP